MNLVPLTALALAMTLAGAPADDADKPSAAAWRFVLPAPGDPFEHAPFRALVLDREKPEDLIEKAALSRRFRCIGAMPRSGSAARARSGSRSCSTRSRRARSTSTLTPTATGGSMTATASAPAPLAAGIAARAGLAIAAGCGDGGEGRHADDPPAPWCSAWVPAAGRSATPRPATSKGPSTLGEPGCQRQTPRSAAWPRAGSTATATAWSPTPQDRLWIDLNGDGRFDPSAEQFLFATVLNLDGARYVVRSDELGSRLAIEPLIGVGTLRLAWKAGRLAIEQPAVPSSCIATALGRDGSVFGLSGTEPAYGAGRRVPARHRDDLPRRSQGRPALVVHLLRQRRQGRAPLVQGREGRRGRDRPDRHADLRDQPERQPGPNGPGPARMSTCSRCSTPATGC